MPVIHAVQQTPFKSLRRMDTAIFNATCFTPGVVPPILPYLNICNTISDSTFRSYDPHLKSHIAQDDWVLQSVVFYAHAEQEFHPDYANKLTWKRNRWTMHILERSLSTNDHRTVLIEPTFNPQGQLHGITMCLETTENASLPVNWAVQHFEVEAVPYKPPNGSLSRDFYHDEFVGYLNNRGWQECYMRVLPADRTGFFLNVIKLLAEVGAIDRSTINMLYYMVEETVWSNNSVPHPPELPTTVSPFMIFRSR
ncbi:hypothetical protein OPQ81_010752 [Rhizoctonia solani]|nr:hypothetical protein OPQ81_010752 [Rhizoctonia solani]